MTFQQLDLNQGHGVGPMSLSSLGDCHLVVQTSDLLEKTNFVQGSRVAQKKIQRRKKKILWRMKYKTANKVRFEHTLSQHPCSFSCHLLSSIMPLVHITWLPKACRTAKVRKEIADAVMKVGVASSTSQHCCCPCCTASTLSMVSFFFVYHSSQATFLHVCFNNAICTCKTPHRL